MHTRTFPRIGARVSEVGLGTWQLGGGEWGDVPEADALATLEAAAEAGVTLIDTADIYGRGRSEELIGRFLAGRSDRDRFFLATKLGRFPEPGMPDNFEPKNIRRHTENSLRRLGVERIDLMQTHCIPDEVMKRGEVWRTLRELREEGLIRAFGASVETMDEAATCLDVEGLASLQIIFNVFRQKPIEALFEKAKEREIAVIARVALASGLLTGKMNHETSFAENDHRRFNRDGEAFNVGETFAGLPFDRGVTLADELKPWTPEGMSMAQFALRWCLDFEAVAAVIPGGRRPEQIRENAAASDLPPLPTNLHARLKFFYKEKVAPHIRGGY